MLYCGDLPRSYYAQYCSTNFHSYLLTLRSDGDDLGHINWHKVLETLEKHGASVEHNMQAVREYADNAMAKEMGQKASTTPRYVVRMVYLFICLLVLHHRVLCILVSYVLYLTSPLLCGCGKDGLFVYYSFDTRSLYSCIVFIFHLSSVMATTS